MLICNSDRKLYVSRAYFNDYYYIIRYFFFREFFYYKIKSRLHLQLKTLNDILGNSTWYEKTYKIYPNILLAFLVFTGSY